jgi:hypothetical protein
VAWIVARPRKTYILLPVSNLRFLPDLYSRRLESAEHDLQVGFLLEAELGPFWASRIFEQLACFEASRLNRPKLCTGDVPSSADRGWKLPCATLKEPVGPMLALRMASPLRSPKPTADLPFCRTSLYLRAHFCCRQQIDLAIAAVEGSPQTRKPFSLPNVHKAGPTGNSSTHFPPSNVLTYIWTCPFL